MKQEQKKSENPKVFNTSFVVVLAFGVLAFGLVLAQVGFSAKVAAQTGQTEQKELAKSKLTLEIGQLKMELDKISDLASLEQRAQTLGFIDGSGSLFFVNRFDSLAKAF